MAAMMNGNTATQDGLSVPIAEKLQFFRNSDAERDQLVQRVLQNYEQLKHEYADKCTDYENEIASRRMWQQKHMQLDRQISESRQASETNPFVLALIDGDGAIFQDASYQSGATGGADAAHRLHTAIRSHIAERYPDVSTSHWSIMVQVFYNMEGLARKLRSVGVLQSVSESADFARAFALNQPLFSCIDVGAGKERADHKIKETLRLFISNTQCKHIIFGGCHDNGYLPNLDPYKRDGTIASRISLLEGYAVQPGFSASGYQMTRFPDVFRRDPLPERLMSMAPSQAVLKPEPPAAVPQTASPTPSHSSTTSGVRVDSAVRPSLSSPAESSTWAAVGKSGVTGKCINITPSKAPNRRHIITNAYKQRSDPDLPKPDYAAQQRLFDRIRKHKVCNAYHLIGKCEAGEYCDYDHGERLSPGEQSALRHRARTRSCMNRGDCRDFYCTLGHICPYGDKCTGGDQCWFADVHDIDQTPAWRSFESGEKELVKEAA